MGNPKMDGFCWGKSDPKWMMTGGTPMTQDTSILSPTYGILSRGPRLQSKKGPIFDDAFGEASGVDLAALLSMVGPCYLTYKKGLVSYWVITWKKMRCRSVDVSPIQDWAGYNPSMSDSKM